MLLRELPPEKYWSFPSSYTKEKREAEIRDIILHGKSSFQLKTDGHYSAFICDFDGEKCVISRGKSVNTNEFGRLEDRLFFFDALCAAFNKPTRIMGEIYYDHGIDRQVGSVLRAKPEKSKSIQDSEYYAEAQTKVKFTAKDKQDIENNEFFDQKLKWRIFDVWFYEGEDLMETPWIERQKYVKMAAERINHPLVSYVPYYPMDDTFYDKLADIFASDGEGVVVYRNDGKPEPGKRTAHKTLKVKTEVEHLLDVVFTGLEPCKKNYEGKELANWRYWINTRTNEKIVGSYFGEYQTGGSYAPITRNFYYNWPGAVYCGVYDAHKQIVPLCKVSNLTDDLKTSLRDSFEEEWYLCPATIGGMALSEATGLSVRHPYLKSIRKGDLNPEEDCTLSKILSD